MAEINDIVSKQAIEGIKAADTALIAFDATAQKTLTALSNFTAELKKQGITYKDLATVQRAMADEKKKATETEKQAAKILRETEKAYKAEEIRLNKLIEKEKEHQDALKLTVTTRAEAKRQLRAQSAELDKLKSSYDKASPAVVKLTSEMQKNEEFIKTNSSAMEKQRINIGNYSSAFDGIKDSVMNLMETLGITAGLAGALKLVQGVISSTGAAADEFEFTMSGLREQTQFVARAFANFDFSNFLTGLKEANKEGRRYAETLDLIGDLQRANQLQQNDIERQILEQRIIAKNKGNDVQVREAAVKEIIRLEELKLSQTQTITKKGIDNELKNSAFRSKAQEDEVLDFVKNYDKKVNAIKEGQSLISKIEAQTTKTVPTKTGIYADVVDSEARKKAFAGLSAQQKEAVRLANLEKQLTDEKRISLTAAIDADQKATNEMLSGKESLIRLENSLRNELLKSEKKNEGFTGSVIKQVGAYEKLSTRISETKTQINDLLAAGQQPSTALLTQLQKDEEQLVAVGKAAEFAALKLVAMQQGDITAMQGKGVTGVTSTSKGSKSPLTARTTTTTGAPTGTELFAEGELNQLAIEAAQTTTNATFEIIKNASTAEYDLKLSLLEKEKEAKLSNTKLTEAQKAKIEADYAKKSAKLKTEQFKKDKAAAIIQSIINTALAVVSALKTGPAMAIAAGIAGAAQTAIIASQKVPQFDAGTPYSPSTFIAGERRPEFMIDPAGRVSLVTKPTLFKNKTGSTIIGGEQTKKLMEQGVTAVDLRPDILAMRNDIVNTIKNKKELHISGTTGKITEREGNYYKTYFNRKTWVGRNN